MLTISELQYLNRNLSSQELPRNADIESLKAGWENERQSYLSTIQSLKDLLAQTHKLRGLDKVNNSVLVKFLLIIRIDKSVVTSGYGRVITPR